MQKRSHGSLLNMDIRIIFPVLATLYWQVAQPYVLYPENIDEVDIQDKILAWKWAPKVWLDEGEEFYPSSINFFLRDVKMVDSNGTEVSQPNILTESNLPTGKPSYFLTTKKELQCPNCTDIAMLHGQNPREVQVPVYAIVKDTGNCTKEISYTFFYPYSKGKTVCLHQEHPLCGGRIHQLGNHVGDWEHIAIQFDGHHPTEMFVAYHSFGFTYKWNGTSFRRGNETVHMDDGHPIIYSAEGSHGSWVRPGRHIYQEILGVKLSDETSAGTAWETWKNLRVIKHLPSYLDYSGRNTFMGFQGMWGNMEQGCDFKQYIGVCTLDSGPKRYN